MIERIQEDKTVCKQESLIFVLKVLRVLVHIR